MALFLAVMASVLLHSTLPMVAYVLASLAVVFPVRDLRSQWLVYRQITLGVVLQCAAVLAVVVAVAMMLLSLGSPVLDWGWWQWIAGLADQPGTGGTILAAPLNYPLLIPVLFALLIPMLPRLALSEELLFRRGTRSWREGVARSITFGLAHLTMGVPIGLALALSVGGLWFTYQYFRGGVALSTVHHVAYNCLALLLAVGVMLIVGK